MADPTNNNNSAGRQQRAGQQPTATPLQLYMRRDFLPNESLDIERLLSSSFYRGATSSYTFNDPSPSNSTGTIFIPDDDGDSPGLLEVEFPDDCASAKNKNKAPAQGKAGGAKRKTDAGRSEGPGERRKQICEAQRAYRQRKISQTAYLEERVKQLESVIENMSSVVLSFSEELIDFNILSCQSEFTGRLRDALATCLTLVRETRNGSREPEPVAGGGPSSQASTALVPSILPAVPNKPASIKNISINKPYLDMNTSLAVADFMDMLATSVVYHGYLALADPTVSTTHLHRHFGLPLQLMTRDKLLSYFFVLFQTRIYQTPGADCPAKPGMPFFSIGGAGTHYSPAFASSSLSAPLFLPWVNTADQSETWSVRNNAWTVPMDPANLPANLPANIQDLFEGDWFDMQDLELFLIEKGVSLRMMPNKESIGDVNVPLFLRGLMSNSTCLEEGTSMLSLAVRRKDELLLRQLLNAGADVNLRDKSPTGLFPLMLAIMKRHIKFVLYLLTRGAEVELRDKTGRGVQELLHESKFDSLQDFVSHMA